MKKEEALKKAKEHYWFLSEFPEWNNDKEIVLAVVQQDGLSIRYASNELKKDHDIIVAAIQQNGNSLQYISKKLKKEIVLIAVQKSWFALRYVSKRLKNDKDIVIAAIQQEAFAFQFASTELRKDKEVVLIAVRNDIYAYHYSLLEGYQTFDEIVKKEGESFLFSCWNNLNEDVMLQVANHPNFLPTLEQIEYGLKDKYKEVKEVYQLRKDEWLAKMEENKLRNAI